MKEEWIKIHKAIHSGATHVTIGVIDYEVKVASYNRCKFVEWYDSKVGKTVQFMEQNKRTQTTYAKRAREGEHITWAIPLAPDGHRSGKWTIITDRLAV